MTVFLVLPSALGHLLVVVQRHNIVPVRRESIPFSVVGSMENAAVAADVSPPVRNNNSSVEKQKQKQQ